MLLLCASVCASQAQKLEGSWTGKLSVQGVQLTLVFHVEKDKNNGFIDHVLAEKAIGAKRKHVQPKQPAEPPGLLTLCS